MAKTNYVDNKLFLKEISAYRKAVRKAKREKAPKPRIPEYVGQCFMLIAENMSHKYNFLTYSWRDEMVSDAIENCVMYADNFNPAKSKNPFAYFSQIVYYAFLRRIQREKKQLYVKYKSTELHGILDDFNQMESDDGMTRQFEQYDNISEFIQKFEDAKAAKKAKAVAKGLEKFIE
jgi:hypothetical protein